MGFVLSVALEDTMPAHAHLPSWNGNPTADVPVLQPLTYGDTPGWEVKKGWMSVCERAGHMRTEVTPNKHSLLATWVSLQAFPHSGSQKKTWGCFCTAALWTPALNALRYIVGPLEQLWGKGCEREKKVFSLFLSLNPKELRWSAHLLALTAASMCSTDVTVFHQLIFFSLLRALTSSFSTTTKCGGAESAERYPQHIPVPHVASGHHSSPSPII